jgi:hypothetical protein
MALIVGMALETQRKIRVMRLEALEKPESIHDAVCVDGGMPPESERLVQEVMASLRSQRYVA